MFIFDFVAETVLDQIIDWLYGKIVGFLNDFFAMMNNMGVELFDLPWVNAITTFFGWLGWALFVVGLVVGAFECAIEYQGGRGSIKDTALNYVKGFMAVSLFSFLPVNLYSLSVSLQSSFGSALSGITDAESIGMTATAGAYVSRHAGSRESDPADILCRDDGVCRDKSVFRESEKRRHSAHTDRSWKPLYVFCSKRIY